MDVLVRAGMCAGIVLLAAVGLGLYVVINVVLANLVNYAWHFGEPTEEGDET